MDCQNYIRVLVKLEHNHRDELLVCGTNAFNPMCRHYLIADNELRPQVVKEFSGRGFCPYDPRHNSTSIYAGEYQQKMRARPGHACTKTVKIILADE